MTWKIEFDPVADKDLDKLDHQIARRILKFLYERVAPLEILSKPNRSLAGCVLDTDVVEGELILLEGLCTGRLEFIESVQFFQNKIEHPF